jgi:hypothetical protein
MLSDLKMLLSLGHSVWGVVYKHSSDDDAALEYIRDTYKHPSDNDAAEDYLRGRPVPKEVLGRLSMDHVALWLFTGRWVDQGAPRILLDDQLAASLMATDVGLDSIPFIKPPWRAFMIEVPPGILVHGSRSFQRILVHYATFEGKPRWFYSIRELNENEDPEADMGLFTKATTEEMVLGDWDDNEGMDDQLVRINYLVGRLILSLCLALSDPTTTTLREQKRSKGRGNRFRTPYSVPDTRNFIVGRPITVDCRPAIRDYVEGRNKKTGSISVQVLVRGHWKHQVHGVGRALRKLIHIEPYWKGPEEAKILLRATKVQG